MNEEKKACCADWKSHRCAHIAFSVLAVLLAVFLVMQIFGWGKHDDANAEQNTIVVTGTAKLTVKPDMATVSFSIMNENMDVSKATAAVNTKMAAVLAKLKADGIADADVQTTGYDISPQYNYVTTPIYNGSVSNMTVVSSSGTRTLAGYEVTQSVTVKIRDLAKAGAVVTDLGALGVTNMSGLTFTEDKYDDLLNQARDEAIANAKSRAQDLAKALGVRLSKIVSYSENGPVYYGVGMMNAAVPTAAKASDAVLPTGENTVSANVSITYEIQQ